MSQKDGGNWKVKGRDQSSEGLYNNKGYYRGSPKNNRYFRTSNSGFIPRDRNHRNRDDYEYENDKTNTQVEYVQKKTGYHFSKVEIENLLKKNNVNDTIDILRDKYKFSYSRIVSGKNSNNNLEEEQSPKKSKKTNGSQVRENLKNQTEGNNQSLKTGNTGQDNTKKQTQQTSNNQTQQTGNTNQTSKTQTENIQQNGHTKENGHFQSQHTSHPKEVNLTQKEEDVTIDDLKVFERNLSEKQLQLNKQTEILNRLLEEYSTIKDTRSRKIEELKTEKESLEIKKKLYLEEMANINKILKDLDEQIITSEKDLVQQLLLLQKKAETLKFDQTNPQKSRKI